MHGMSPGTTDLAAVRLRMRFQSGASALLGTLKGYVVLLPLVFCCMVFGLQVSMALESGGFGPCKKLYRVASVWVSGFARRCRLWKLGCRFSEARPDISREVLPSP